MQISALLPNDVNEALELQPPDWNDISPFLHAYTTASIYFPIKVVENHQIIGIGNCIFQQDTAWLAHIIVRNSHRGQGLGAKITAHLMQEALKRNYKSIYLVATPLGESVYEKLGFKIQGEYVFRRGACLLPGESSIECIIPYHEKFKEAIFYLDRMACGEHRSMRLEHYLDHAYLYVEQGELLGFYLPDMYEGYVVAMNERAGLTLLNIRMQQKDFAIVPALNTTAQTYLEEQNFNIFRTAKRMFYGEALPWNPKIIYHRVSGQIG